MNQKPYNTQLINFICSDCTKKYLPFFRPVTSSSFDLYENFRQILSSTLTSYYAFFYCYLHLIFCHMTFFSYIYKFTRVFIHSPFLYFDLYLNTAYAAHYLLCLSLTKGLRSKCQTSLIFRFVLYFNITFISICLFTYMNKKCQCFS